MAAAIGPGDWVECVDASIGRFNRLLVLKLHGIYRISRVWPNGGLSLIELSHLIDPYDGGEHCWHEGRFRPIYRPKADFIESLKAPPVKAPRTREDA